MILKSRAPIKEKWSVLGIGVAVRVSVSTVSRNNLSFSLCATPKRCSSSIIIRPRSVNLYLSDKILCVPMRISILPSCKSSAIWSDSLPVLKRDINCILTGKSLNLSLKVLKC